MTSLLAAVQVLALLPDFLDFLEPETILETAGDYALPVVLAIVFAECGLLVFFLPGDSLLFTVGVLTAAGFISEPIWLSATLIAIFAVLGDQVGYYIGKRAGPAIFDKPDSRFFRQEYLQRANGFFERYGGRTVFLARFVPIIRTAAPVSAGASGWAYGDFVRWNVLGGIAWGAGVTLLGYVLGDIPFIRENIEAILILIVVVSVLPIVVELLLARRRTRTARTGPPRNAPVEDEG